MLCVTSFWREGPQESDIFCYGKIHSCLQFCKVDYSRLSGKVQKPEPPYEDFGRFSLAL
jgi:hypothetical protein